MVAGSEGGSPHTNVKLSWEFAQLGVYFVFGYRTKDVKEGAAVLISLAQRGSALFERRKIWGICPDFARISYFGIGQRT